MGMPIRPLVLLVLVARTAVAAVAPGTPGSSKPSTDPHAAHAAPVVPAAQLPADDPALAEYGIYEKTAPRPRKTTPRRTQLPLQLKAGERVKPLPPQIKFPWRQQKSDETGWRSNPTTKGQRQRMSERKSQLKPCGSQPARQSLTSSRKRALVGVRDGAFKRRQRTAKPCD